MVCIGTTTTWIQKKYQKDVWSKRCTWTKQGTWHISEEYDLRWQQDFEKLENIEAPETMAGDKLDNTELVVIKEGLEYQDS